MSKKRLSGSINLQKLVHVKTQMKGRGGNMVDVLILPIEENGFHVGEKSINMNFDVVINESPDQYGNDGFISKRTPYKTLYGKDAVWNELTDEQKQKVNNLSPILGNFRDFSNDSVGSNNSKSLDLQPVDLPFDDSEDTGLPF